jgi:hypothetical protein
MDLEKILAIAGKPGLYRLLTQTRNGIIIESLTDGKRTMADMRQRISRLSEISIYSTGEDKPLADVFKAIKTRYGNDLPVNPKSDARALLDFFSEVVPDFDRERVYPSDIKKVVNWYLILKDLPEENKAEKDSGTGEQNSSH